MRAIQYKIIVSYNLNFISDIFILIEFLNKMDKQSRVSNNWRTRVTKTYEDLLPCQ